MCCWTATMRSMEAWSLRVASCLTKCSKAASSVGGGSDVCIWGSVSASEGGVAAVLCGDASAWASSGEITRCDSGSIIFY